MRVNLLVLGMTTIDVILEMDWLSDFGVTIHCKKRRISLQIPGSLQLEFEAKRTSEASMFSVAEESVREIPAVVAEFMDVFPDVVPGLPPDWVIEFIIDLVPGAEPVSKAPYKLALVELEELKKQLQDLETKGFIRSSASSWGAHVLFVTKKDGTRRIMHGL